MLTRPTFIYRLGGIMIAAAVSADHGWAQPPGEPVSSPAMNRPYPWPAPVDSAGRWMDNDARAASLASDPFAYRSGQVQQRQLAEAEAARAANQDSPNNGKSRWSLPWPSALKPNWLSRSKPDDTPPSDPFLRMTDPQRGVSAPDARNPRPSYPPYSNTGYPNTGTGLVSPGRATTSTRSPSSPAYGDSARTASLDIKTPRQLNADQFEPARIVAWVGDKPVLAGDLLGQINEMLLPLADQFPEEEIQKQRERLMRQLLPSLVDLHLLYLDFVRAIPEDRLKEAEGRIAEQFNKAELDRLVEQSKTSSPKELDAKLRKFGSSLVHQRQLYVLKVFAYQALHQNVQVDEEVTRDEMLAYYHEHIKDYEYPAKARWERLMVRFEEFPTKEAAKQALADMGNQVLRGVPFAEVARRHSQGPRAEDGGYHDWTTQGSLVSEVLDRAIFVELEVGRPSPILEDAHGYHIIRVIERRPAGRIDFVEAQVGIDDKILKERRQAKEKEYLARLRRQTLVRTIFDSDQFAAPRTAAETQRSPAPPYR